MRLNFALISSFLLASAVLADCRRQSCRSRSVIRVEQSADAAFDEVEYSSIWSGAIWVADDGTFDVATGTFTVPIPSGDTGSTASAWVGIDGSDSCTDVLLQAGVDFTVTDNGATYKAWYEWYPDPAYYFSDLDVYAGDVIRVNIIAFTSTSGIVTIENFTSGQSRSMPLNSTHALCGRTAEWIVEDYTDLVPFADFGTVTFTVAVATGPGGRNYMPDLATIINIQQNGQVLTYVSTYESSVTINYAQ